MKHWQDSITDLKKIISPTSRFGLITDMDGTLSPIVADPDKAVILPEIHDLLLKLLPQVTLLALVSGRSVADLRARLDDPGLVYIGNHGFEWYMNDQFSTAPEVQAHRPALEATLAALNPHQQGGVLIEDKGATLSIHYRQTSDPAAAQSRLRPIIEQLIAQNNLSLFEGRMVFEIRPPVTINKGTALSHLVEHYQLDSVIYMGDDTTDADALNRVRQLREAGHCEGFGLGVISSDTPRVVLDSADLSLSGIPDVAVFLEWLLNACTASSN